MTTVRKFVATTGLARSDKSVSYDTILIDAQNKLFFKETSSDTIADLHLDLEAVGFEGALIVAKGFLTEDLSNLTNQTKEFDLDETLTITVQFTDRAANEDYFIFKVDSMLSIEGDVTALNEENIDALIASNPFIVESSDDTDVQEVQETAVKKEEQPVPVNIEQKEIDTPEHVDNKVTEEKNPVTWGTQAEELEKITKAKSVFEMDDSVTQLEVKTTEETVYPQQDVVPKPESTDKLNASDEQEYTIEIEPHNHFSSCKEVTVTYEEERSEDKDGILCTIPTLQNKTLGIYSIEGYTVNFLTLQGIVSLSLNPDQTITDTMQAEFVHLVKTLWGTELKLAKENELEPCIQNVFSVLAGLN